MNNHDVSQNFWRNLVIAVLVTVFASFAAATPSPDAGQPHHPSMSVD
jgi:hypothetical protein